MSDSIHVKLPDGSSKEVAKGATALDVAKSISPRLADAALAAKTNGNLIDLTRPLEKDTDLRILTEKDPEALEVFRHSSAHLMAAAVLELFPETKLGHGPATENGFFYDFYRPTPFTPEDLEKIEKKMQELVQQDLPYAREFVERNCSDVRHGWWVSRRGLNLLAQFCERQLISSMRPFALTSERGPCPVRPAPKPHNISVSPDLMRPARNASSRAMGIEPPDVLPYR